jgi:5-methylcytosine-specific restriction endonuclease McrA
MNRECSVCGELKVITEYPKNGKDKEGNTRYRTDCKVCYNITRKLTKQKAVTKFLNNTKKRTGEVKTYDLHDWKDAMLHFKGCCAYCGVKQTRKIKLTRDHVVPVTQLGPTTRENIVPACAKCNSSKSNLNLVDWFTKKKFYTSERLELIKAWTNLT